MDWSHELRPWARQENFRFSPMLGKRDIHACPKDSAPQQGFRGRSGADRPRFADRGMTVVRMVAGYAFGARRDLARAQ